MKLSLDPLQEVKYDYLEESEKVSGHVKAHSIYSSQKSQDAWKDLVYFAKEELNLCLDLLEKSVKGDLLRITQSTIDLAESGNLKRLVHVKQDILLKNLEKISREIQEYQNSSKEQEKWIDLVKNLKLQNWSLQNSRGFWLDYGFGKIGSSLDFKIEIRKDLEIQMVVEESLWLKWKNKTSSSVTDLQSREQGFFKEIENANFGVLDKEITELLIKGDLEEKHRNFKKGNDWILMGFEFLQVGNFRNQDMELEEDNWLNILVIMLRYRMLEVYKRNFRNRGISSDSTSVV